jgi:hypothetical protein
MVGKTWRPDLIHTDLIKILERKGSLTDSELYGFLKEDYGSLEFGELNRTLMKLEIWGRIYVSSITKDKRRIELVDKAHQRK